MKIYDLSQPLAESTAVWPGDQPFALAWSMRQDRGDSVNVAAITLSVHTGTHADGAFHFLPDGNVVADVPLETYIGRAQVIDARGHTSLDERVLELFEVDAPRLLFRTRDAVDERRFPEQVAAPTPAFARALAERGVRLFGTDAPSVDPIESKTLDAHHAFGQAGIAILENLVLSEVPPGIYTLVALPLRLTDADSSPVRAVLVDGDPREL